MAKAFVRASDHTKTYREERFDHNGDREDITITGYDEHGAPVRPIHEVELTPGVRMRLATPEKANDLEEVRYDQVEAVRADIAAKSRAWKEQVAHQDQTHTVIGEVPPIPQGQGGAASLAPEASGPFDNQEDAEQSVHEGNDPRAKRR